MYSITIQTQYMYCAFGQCCKRGNQKDTQLPVRASSKQGRPPGPPRTCSTAQCTANVQYHHTTPVYVLYIRAGRAMHNLRNVLRTVEPSGGGRGGGTAPRAARLSARGALRSTPVQTYSITIQTQYMYCTFGRGSELAANLSRDQRHSCTLMDTHAHS
jgi:hypothetical protein